MSIRTFIYRTLMDDPEISAICGTRVFQGTAMRESKGPKPFLVYHVGNDTDENLAETSEAHRLFFMVYMHDEVGDYQQIDVLNKLVKKAFKYKGSPVDNIIMARYLETSQDLMDETLLTIFSYARFQLIMDS